MFINIVFYNILFYKYNITTLNRCLPLGLLSISLCRGVIASDTNWALFLKKARRICWVKFPWITFGTVKRRWGLMKMSCSAQKHSGLPALGDQIKVDHTSLESGGGQLLRMAILYFHNNILYKILFVLPHIQILEQFLLRGSRNYENYNLCFSLISFCLL